MRAERGAHGCRWMLLLPTWNKLSFRLHLLDYQGRPQLAGVLRKAPYNLSSLHPMEARVTMTTKKADQLQEQRSPPEDKRTCTSSRHPSLPGR